MYEEDDGEYRFGWNVNRIHNESQIYVAFLMRNMFCTIYLDFIWIYWKRLNQTGSAESSHFMYSKLEVMLTELFKLENWDEWIETNIPIETSIKILNEEKEFVDEYEYK